MTAAEFLRSNKVVASGLSSREISEFIPAAIRQQSLFSARTIDAHYLSETQKDIAELLEGKIGPVEIRARMKYRLDLIGYAPLPGQEGTLQDLSSDLRTNLIIDMQEQRARGYAVWKSQQTPAKLLVWPANELYRAVDRKVPRDWKLRWNQARADLGERDTSATYALTREGPFVALKNDPIWVAISRFGSPWPPFDFQSGMRLRQVKASTARDLGVLVDTRPSPAADPMRQVEAASCADMPKEIVDAWVEPFGRRAVVTADTVHVCPDASVIDEVIDAAKTPDTTAEAVVGFIPERAQTAINNLFPDVPPLPVNTGVSITSQAVRSISSDENITEDDVRYIAETLSKTGAWMAPSKRGSPEDDGTSATFHSSVSGITSFWGISRSDTHPLLRLWWLRRFLRGD